MSFKQIAQQAKEIEKELGLTTDDVLNKLSQKAGEFNDAIQKYRGRYCKTTAETNDNIKDELGDVIFNIISLCIEFDIDPNDLEKFAEATLKKFIGRKDLYRH